MFGDVGFVPVAPLPAYPYGTVVVRLTECTAALGHLLQALHFRLCNDAFSIAKRVMSQSRSETTTVSSLPSLPDSV